MVIGGVQKFSTVDDPGYVVAGLFTVGCNMTNDATIYDKLFYNLNTTGAVLSPFDSYLLLRGLKTLALRMERSTQNAQEVVAFLKQSPISAIQIIRMAI